VFDNDLDSLRCSAPPDRHIVSWSGYIERDAARRDVEGCRDGRSTIGLRALVSIVWRVAGMAGDRPHADGGALLAGAERNDDGCGRSGVDLEPKKAGAAR